SRPAPKGSRSRPCSNVTADEFFVSPNYFQRLCVAHLDADRTSDLPADVAQQGGLSRRRDRSWPALGIQQVLRNLSLCSFAPPRARLGNNYRLAQFLGKPVRCNVPQPARLLKRKRRRRLQADQVPVYHLVFRAPCRCCEIALRTQDAETTRNPRRPINRVRLVKRKVPLFEVPEHVVCGPVENGVPVQPLGAPRNAGQFRLWLRYGRFGTIRTFLSPDAASRQNGLTRKPLNQCPAYDRGLQFRSAESHRGRRPREDEFHATQFRVSPYVVLPSRAPAIQEIAGLSPHYDQLQPQPVGESVACRQ